MICYCNGRAHKWGEDCPDEPVTDEDYLERDAEDWHRNMTDKECREWQKARDANVD